MSLHEATQAFQRAEKGFGDRMMARGILFDPALGVEAGLLAALPHLKRIKADEFANTAVRGTCPACGSNGPCEDSAKCGDAKITHPPAQAARVDDAPKGYTDANGRFWSAEPVVQAAQVDALDALEQIAHTCREGEPGGETYSVDGHRECVRIADAAIDNAPTAEPVTQGEAATRYCDAEIQLNIEYSHNYATARPDTPAVVREHILGLCERLQSLLDERKQAAQPRAVLDGWDGWAVQYPDRLPKLFGAREIAELNLEVPADLIHVVEVERIVAAPSPGESS